MSVGTRIAASGISLRWLSTYLGHAPVHNKILSVHKTAFVARKEQHSVSLLDGFPKASGGKVNLAAVTLSCVVAKPVLKERRASSYPSAFSSREPVPFTGSSR